MHRAACANPALVRLSALVPARLPSLLLAVGSRGVSAARAAVLEHVLAEALEDVFEEEEDDLRERA